jgi:hypothetical protein
MAIRFLWPNPASFIVFLVRRISSAKMRYVSGKMPSSIRAGASGWIIDQRSMTSQIVSSTGFISKGRIDEIDLLLKVSRYILQFHSVSIISEAGLQSWHCQTNSCPPSTFMGQIEGIA